MVFLWEKDSHTLAVFFFVISCSNGYISKEYYTKKNYTVNSTKFVSTIRTKYHNAEQYTKAP